MSRRGQRSPYGGVTPEERREHNRSELNAVTMLAGVLGLTGVIALFAYLLG